MTTADILILVSVIIIVGVICFFSFFRKGKNKCGSCPHSKSCNNRGDNLQCENDFDEE